MKLNRQTLQEIRDVAAYLHRGINDDPNYYGSSFISTLRDLADAADRLDALLAREGVSGNIDEFPSLVKIDLKEMGKEQMDHEASFYEDFAKNNDMIVEQARKFFETEVIDG